MASIVIADDLPVNRRLIKALLRDRGHTLLEACDGASALALVKREPVDLIISDVTMPVMDGYEMVSRLQRDFPSRKVPVIFYTAHYGARELALKQGIAWFLTNAQPAILPEIVDRVLAGEREVPQRPSSREPDPLNAVG